MINVKTYNVSSHLPNWFPKCAANNGVGMDMSTSLLLVPFMKQKLIMLHIVEPFTV